MRRKLKAYTMSCFYVVVVKVHFVSKLVFISCIQSLHQELSCFILRFKMCAPKGVTHAYIIQSYPTHAFEMQPLESCVWSSLHILCLWKCLSTMNITPDLLFLNIQNPFTSETISVNFDKHTLMSLGTKYYFVKQISHLTKGVVIVASA